MKVAKIYAVGALLLGMIGFALIGGAAAAAKPAIFVANSYDVTAYPIDSNGNVAPIALTTDMIGPVGIARDSSGRIYVANSETNTVTVYAASSNGNVRPLAVIGGPNSQLANPDGIALDASGKIYVLNGGEYPGNITVYPPLGTSTGILDEAPIAAIAGANTLLDQPTGIAVDSRGDIYVANAYGGPDVPGPNYAPGVLTVYAAGSNGNIAPVATIVGAATGLVSPLRIALDSAGNIYVANSGGVIYSGKGEFTFDPSVTVYSAVSNGNAAPVAIITGNDADLDYPQGLSLDSSGNIYLAEYTDGVGYGVNIYSAGSDGNAAPTATIAGADTGLAWPNGIALDSSGSLYISNGYGGPSNEGSVTVYPAGSSGDVAPTITITSNLTGVRGASSIAVDSNGQIYVANKVGGPSGDGSVTIYPAGSYAVGSPVATIAGDNTGLHYPLKIAVDFTGRILVMNDDNAITVYSAGSTGDVTPNATIKTDRTATSMAVDTQGNLYVTNHAGVKCSKNGRACHKVSLPSVVVYPADSESNAKPSAVIRGPNTELGSPSAIAVDDSGTIYVTDEGPTRCKDGCCFSLGPGAVSVYAPGSNGDAVPSARIKGRGTGLWLPYGIALRPNRNIYVLNDGAPISYGGLCAVAIPFLAGAPLSIFAAGSHGDVAPIGAIGGPFTGLYGPAGIAIGPGGP